MQICDTGRHVFTIIGFSGLFFYRFQCFKGAWMSQVFHRGFSFPTNFKKLRSAQLVNGKDVGWTLGALIYKTRYLPLR